MLVGLGPECMDRFSIYNPGCRGEENMLPQCHESLIINRHVHYLEMKQLAGIQIRNSTYNNNTT